jgi:hypothetical protein
MVQFADDRFLDDARDGVEVLDHPGRRAAPVEWPLEGDLEPVRVPVKARALPGMVREHVSGLEREGLADLHGPRVSP